MRQVEGGRSPTEAEKAGAKSRRR